VREGRETINPSIRNDLDQINRNLLQPVNLTRARSISKIVAPGMAAARSISFESGARVLGTEGAACTVNAMA
jgi:hypothetical protein